MRFAIVAFGGAGPLHACQIADLLGVTRMLLPDYAGVFLPWERLWPITGTMLFYPILLPWGRYCRKRSMSYRRRRVWEPQGTR
ncbi:MAG: hypothetical protein DRP87_08435 [Spirochaetes bacterium]|nr:MAG: hypothetical protein DRP87_08435 [Spirochaetota bacterium]